MMGIWSCLQIYSFVITEMKVVIAHYLSVNLRSTRKRVGKERERERESGLLPIDEVLTIKCKTKVHWHKK